MDYTTALQKLEALRLAIEEDLTGSSRTTEQRHQLYMLYGECEEIIRRFTADAHIRVPQGYGAPPVEYPNFIEAGFLSGRSIHSSAGYAQLVKVIGKVREAARYPGGLPIPQSVDNLIQTLRRFRECCQFIKTPPRSESEVQDILWIMLRSHHDRVDRENTLPRFGTKAYKPDFGIPGVATLVEVKFVGEKTELGAIQEEICADVPGYLSEASLYTGIIELVYDYAQKMRDSRPFIEDLRKVEGILDVIVVPGIGG